MLLFHLYSDCVFFLLMDHQLYLDRMNSEETTSCLISVLHRVHPSDTEAWCVHEAIDIPHTLLGLVRVFFTMCTPSRSNHLCHGAIRRYSVLKEAVQVLDDLPVLETNSDLRAQICLELLPFMLITNLVPESAELKLAQCVAETHLLSQHPLTQGWANGTRT